MLYFHQNKGPLVYAFQVIALQAQRKAPSLPQAEAELLLKINQGSGLLSMRNSLLLALGGN